MFGSFCIQRIPLPPCGGHKEVILTDLALPWVVPVMQSLKEIRDDKTVVAVKKQPPCYNFSFALGILLVGNIFGHYPRQCEICERYFLMTSARRQRYCTGMSPYTFRGKQISCKQYAASINRKELAAADPVVDIYNRRCGAIRSEKSRGSITEALAAKAKELALEHKLQAQEDPQYASTQYALDMQRDALYAEAFKHLT